MFRAVINSQYTYTNSCDVTSNSLKDFLNHLLLANPNSRMNIIQALKHPWMKVFVMKNQPLHQIYQDFVKCVKNIDDGVNLYTHFVFIIALTIYHFCIGTLHLIWWFCKVKWKLCGRWTGFRLCDAQFFPQLLL